MWHRKCKLESNVYCKYVHACACWGHHKNVLFHSVLFLDYRIVERGLLKWFPLASCDVDTSKYPKAIMIIIAIIILFSYLSHVGNCLYHSIIARRRSIRRQNRKAFDACVIRSVNFCLSIQCCLIGY